MGCALGRVVGVEGKRAPKETGGPLHAEVGPIAVKTVGPQLDIQVLPGYSDPASLGTWQLQHCSPLGK